MRQRCNAICHSISVIREYGTWLNLRKNDSWTARGDNRISIKEIWDCKDFKDGVGVRWCGVWAAVTCVANGCASLKGSRWICVGPTCEMNICRGVLGYVVLWRIKGNRESVGKDAQRRALLLCYCVVRIEVGLILFAPWRHLVEVDVWLQSLSTSALRGGLWSS
jgi:hypothetical protein